MCKSIVCKMGSDLTVKHMCIDNRIHIYIYICVCTRARMIICMVMCKSMVKHCPIEITMYNIMMRWLLFQDIVWFWFGRGLAVTNVAYFAVNMLCFLVPQFLPRAFERYFRERDEMHAKMAQDKRSSAPLTSDASHQTKAE